METVIYRKLERKDVNQIIELRKQQLQEEGAEVTTESESLGIRTSDNMYATALHVYELYKNALSGIKGRYFEDGIYNVNELAAAEFDKNFPVKEIVIGTSSQRRFEQICTMRRKAD